MPHHNVSRAMSTQHPDNVHQPFFSDNPELGSDDEIKEAFYAYSHINCKEQLWDCEGRICERIYGMIDFVEWSLRIAFV